MNVVRAQHAGACYGVRRALQAADDALEAHGEVCTLGPLIHNPQVVRDLDARGAHVADGVDDVTCDTVIIRSHGVTPAVRAALEARGLDVVDATCPHVARAQAAAADLAAQGCRVIVVGEQGHPEVEGLMSCALEAGARVDVAAGPEDIPADVRDPVGVVVQTTQMAETLDAVVAALGARGLAPQVRNTICSATSHRQAAAAELAERADAMVVIGGRNSSNTTRLAEICAQTCPCVLHVEAAAELAEHAALLRACGTVGVTAGASTPEDQIAAAVDFLNAL